MKVKKRSNYAGVLVGNFKNQFSALSDQAKSRKS